MRRILSATSTAAVVAVAVAGVAVAATTGDSYTATAKAGASGPKFKPAPVAVSFEFTGKGPAAGARPTTPKTLTFLWENVKENGAAFPKCTAAQIDAAQSDSPCPKGSLVATGGLKAQLGPEGNRTSNASCVKGLKLYNGGAGQAVLYVTGDASQCAGVGYLPPIKMPYKKVKGASMLTLPFPANISHPLPGLEGAFSEMKLSFKKLTVKKAGKTVGYLTAAGKCKGAKRAFTLGVIPEGSFAADTAKTTAGKC